MIAKRDRVGEGYDGSPIIKKASARRNLAGVSGCVSRGVFKFIPDVKPFFYPFKRILFWHKMSEPIPPTKHRRGPQQTAG